MYFVTKVSQSGFHRTIETNVRMGGFKQIQTANNAAKKNSPAFIRNHSREIIGQTVNKDLPNFVT